MILFRSREGPQISERVFLCSIKITNIPLFIFINRHFSITFSEQKVAGTPMSILKMTTQAILHIFFGKEN